MVIFFVFSLFSFSSFFRFFKKKMFVFFSPRTPNVHIYGSRRFKHHQEDPQSLDRFHSIYCIGRKTSRRMYVVRGEINEKTADIQARSFMARNLEENGNECQAEGKAKMVE